MSLSEYWAKKQDEANKEKTKEELERMVNDRGQTYDQRMSAKRVLKEGKN